MFYVFLIFATACILIPFGLIEKTIKFKFSGDKNKSNKFFKAIVLSICCAFVFLCVLYFYDLTWMESILMALSVIARPMFVLPLYGAAWVYIYQKRERTAKIDKRKIIKFILIYEIFCVIVILISKGSLRMINQNSI